MVVSSCRCCASNTCRYKYDTLTHVGCFHMFNIVKFNAVSEEEPFNGFCYSFRDSSLAPQKFSSKTAKQCS